MKEKMKERKDRRKSKKTEEELKEKLKHVTPGSPEEAEIIAALDQRRNADMRREEGALIAVLAEVEAEQEEKKRQQVKMNNGFVSLWLRVKCRATLNALNAVRECGFMRVVFPSFCLFAAVSSIFLLLELKKMF